MDLHIVDGFGKAARRLEKSVLLTGTLFVLLASASTLTFVNLASEIREGELSSFDRATTSVLVALRGRWDAPMLAFTWLGSFPILAVLTVLVASVLFVKRRHEQAAYLICCATVSLCVCWCLKFILHRPRPEQSFRYLVAAPDAFSFPSGHAMGSAGVFGAIALLVVASRRGPWVRSGACIAAAVAALAVGASRIYLGVHYPSDVLGGELGAAACVAATTGYFWKRISARRVAA